MVGPMEEFSKFISFFLICRGGRPIQEPLDGMLRAAMVANPARRKRDYVVVFFSIFPAALSRIELGLPARLEKCMGIRVGEVLCCALSAAVLVLQGQTEKGEATLAASYPMLSPRQKLIIRRLARHISSRRTPTALQRGQRVHGGCPLTASNG